MSGGVRKPLDLCRSDPLSSLGRFATRSAMDAGPERYELGQQRRVGARGVLRVVLAERSGGYRFLQALAGPDSSSHSFNHSLR